MNRFRGFLVPQPDWIKVVYLFGTIGLHRLLTKKFSKISVFIKFQNLKKKIQNFKIKKNKNFKVQNFKIFTKF